MNGLPAVFVEFHEARVAKYVSPARGTWGLQESTTPGNVSPGI